MPELPEVETIRLDLIRADLIGARFGKTSILWEKSIATHQAATFSRALEGKTIQKIARQGKSLLFLLDEGALAIHLRMSGKLLIAPYPPRFAPYVRIGFRVGGKELDLIDPRKFARIQLAKTHGELRLAKGIDLLFLPTLSHLELKEVAENLIKGSKMVKAALLDQDLIAGIGNIYADETLWLARLHPTTRLHLITYAKAVNLLKSAALIAERAILAGGTSLGTSRMNFQSALGKPGRYQEQLRVYGRSDLPCTLCKTAIRRIKIDQRSTHFCPACQSH